MNKQSPDFKVTTIEGKTYSSKDLKNKVVVINFWFMACAPCIRELPELNKVVEKYASKNVVFLAISSEDEAEKLTEFIKKRKFSYEIVPQNKEVNEKFNLVLFPNNIVIDNNGTIIFAKMGYIPNIFEVLCEAIEKALIK